MLHMLVVAEDDEPEGAEGGVGGRGQHHLVLPVLYRLLGGGGSDALGIDAGDVDAVRLPQPGSAVRAPDAFVTGGQPHRKPGCSQIAQGPQAVLGRVGRGDRVGVLVERPAGVQHGETTRGRQRTQCRHGGLPVG